MNTPADAPEDRSQRHARWLQQHQEPVIEPDLAVVDPHHHLWDREGERYDLASLQDESRSGHTLKASLYVECLNRYRADGPAPLRCVGETEWWVEQVHLAERDGHRPICQGLIARSDLLLGAAVGPVLQAHARAAGPGLKGFRFCAAHDADPRLRSHYPSPPDPFGQGAVDPGLEAVARAGLPLDVWVYFHQLPAVAAWLERHPPTPIVLDHAGGPIGLGPYAGQRDAVRRQWARHLARFRDMPQVSLKFGGLAMALAGFGWHRRERPASSGELAQAWRPYFDTALSVFGAGRVMFESNFPVDRAGCSQVTLWNAFKTLCEDLPAPHRLALLQNNARERYALH
ncbi:MAG: amidohydrolase [Rhodoferax sp.]|nr:amidohydrolase [Rhodoferax sp.]